MKPRIRAVHTTMKASYMKMRRPSAWVRPIERSTPNSQTASLIFCLVLIIRRKKVMVRAMAVMTATKMLKITSNWPRPLSMADFCKMTTVRSMMMLRIPLYSYLC